MKIFVSWVLRAIAAVILAQTLYFKFTAHPDSVAIFTAIGMEPHGRILIGILELMAALLLLLPSTVLYGAILSWGVMTGAIIGHFTEIGFEDGNLGLFLLGLGVWVSSTVLILLHRKQFTLTKHMFDKRKTKA